MNDELIEGIEDGRYIRLEQGWAVTSRWSGLLVVFKSLSDRFGVLSRNGKLWRCYLGNLETDGMYGVTWWEEYQDIVVKDFEEGVSKIESYLSHSIN